MNRQDSLFQTMHSRNPYSDCQSEIVNADHYSTQRNRRYSYLNLDELEQVKRCFVLVNVINMKMDFKTASKLLDKADLSLEKHEIFSRITQEMTNIDEQRHQPIPNEVEHFKLAFKNKLRKLGRLFSFEGIGQIREVLVLPLRTETCMICRELLAPGEFITIPTCLERFCQSCVKEYLTAKIMQCDVLNISCPSDNCLTIFSEDFIRSLCDQVLFDKYLRFVKIKTLSQDPLLRWCPNDCGRYVRGDYGIIKMNCECGTEICFQCGNFFHRDQSCQDNLDLQYQQAIIAYHIHTCPKCKSPIQKTEGCNHMTCSICHHQFCWLCRRPYTTNHYSPNNFINGCPGMQNVQIPPYQHPRLRIFMSFLLLILGIPLMIVFGIICTVFLLILSGFSGPMLIYMNYIQTKENFLRYSRCRRGLIILTLVSLGTVTYPITMVVFALGLSGILVYGLCLMIFGCLICLRDICKSSL